MRLTEAEIAAAAAADPDDSCTSLVGEVVPWPTVTLYMSLGVPTLVDILRPDGKFEWSEGKRIAVIEARGHDFIDAEMLFDGRPLYTVPSLRGAEERWLSIGELNGRFVCVARRGHSGHHDEESTR